MVRQVEPKGLSRRSRVARFFLVHDTKTGKDVPNGHKISQMPRENSKWL
jgi:hypothetical protein